MITIDDFFEHDGKLIAKTQLTGVSEVKQLAKDSFGFSIMYWDKPKPIGPWSTKIVADAKRDEWIKTNLKRPEIVCKGCGLLHE